MSSVEIGKKLRALRGLRTQKEAANEIGITPSAIGMYERGDRIPKDSIKIKIAKYYKQSVQTIFFEK